MNVKTQVKDLVAVYINNTATNECYNAGIFENDSILLNARYTSPDFGSLLAGKKIKCFGDSIMAHDGDYDSTLQIINSGIPSNIRRFTGTKVLNNAHAGDTTAHILTKINADSFTDTDIVLINGGINDKIQSVTTATMKQNISDMFQKIWTDNESCIIIYINIHFLVNATYDAGFDSYRDAISEICGNYAVPVIESRKECCINELNSSTVTKDGTHPNNTGYAMLNGVIIPFIKSHIKI